MRRWVTWTQWLAPWTQWRLAIGLFIGAALLGWISEAVGGWWAVWLQPVIIALVAGIFPWWRSRCRAMLKHHGTSVERVGLGIGSAALVGLSVLATVLNPELWQQLNETRQLQRLWQPLGVPLQIVPIAAAAVLGGLLYRLLPLDRTWAAVRTGCAVLAVTGTLLLPIMLIWLTHEILNLAFTGLLSGTPCCN